MVHGGHGKRRVAGRKTMPVSGGRRFKGLGVNKKAKAKPKPKSVSIKKTSFDLSSVCSARSRLRIEIEKAFLVVAKKSIVARGFLEGLWSWNLPPEVREAQQAKLEGVKKQQEIHNRLAVERKIFLRDRKIKFFEERLNEESDVWRRCSGLHRFFPKTEKYLSLFMGGDETDIVDRRNKLRKQIKDNIIAAAASGKDLEETGSEDDGLLDLSEDDFFLSGSSSDEADADDEWTDKRSKLLVLSGKTASGMSSDERNQRQISARALMPPPRSSTNSFSNSVHVKSRFGGSSSKKQPLRRAEMSTFSTTSNSTSESSFSNRGSSDSRMEHSSNLSSNSDDCKPRRKRRPKKKRQQVKFI
ncbi:rRNA-processing EFG1-like protein [Actinidia rufa]|uniref:rRNA-processing protein EFG1 n=1 Tax=Actinidia rufa TaxID=165716 RepID=A0A7J0GDG3_9ERIC|nr:rRNA-processing EFG1-like protein [Actinidia rufa]